MVGIGYWGRNVLRNFDELCSVTACVHTGAAENRQWVEENYPGIDVTTEYGQVLADDELDAVAIATPIGTHFDLARRALAADKHVFVEKPLADTVERAERLADAAADRDRVLFVGYLFVHHPLVRRLREEVPDAGVRTAHFTWLKYGPFSEDVRLDLVSHPVSVFLDLFGSTPEAVSRRPSLSLAAGSDTFDATLSFGGDRRAGLTVNRCSAVESKALTVATAGGDTLCWSDRRLYRRDPASGDRVELDALAEEPLERECRAFVNCVADGVQPRTDGAFGVAVNRVLDRLA